MSDETNMDNNNDNSDHTEVNNHQININQKKSLDNTDFLNHKEKLNR